MTKSRYGHGATHEATTTLNLKKNIIQPAFFASRTIKYAHTSLSKGNHQCFFILLARHFQQCVFFTNILATQPIFIFRIAPETHFLKIKQSRLRP